MKVLINVDKYKAIVFNEPLGVYLVNLVEGNSGDIREVLQVANVDEDPMLILSEICWLVAFDGQYSVTKRSHVIFDFWFETLLKNVSTKVISDVNFFV